jgi:hypothetical protein
MHLIKHWRIEFHASRRPRRGKYPSLTAAVQMELEEEEGKENDGRLGWKEWPDVHITIHECSNGQTSLIFQTTRIERCNKTVSSKNLEKLKLI